MRLAMHHLRIQACPAFFLKSQRCAGKDDTEPLIHAAAQARAEKRARRAYGAIVGSHAAHAQKKADDTISRLT